MYARGGGIYTEAPILSARRVTPSNVMSFRMPRHLQGFAAFDDSETQTEAAMPMSMRMRGGKKILAEDAVSADQILFRMDKSADILEYLGSTFTLPILMSPRTAGIYIIPTPAEMNAILKSIDSLLKAKKVAPGTIEAKQVIIDNEHEHSKFLVDVFGDKDAQNEMPYRLGDNPDATCRRTTRNGTVLFAKLVGDQVLISLDDKMGNPSRYNIVGKVRRDIYILSGASFPTPDTATKSRPQKLSMIGGRRRVRMPLRERFLRMLEENPDQSIEDVADEFTATIAATALRRDNKAISSLIKYYTGDSIYNALNMIESEDELNALTDGIIEGDMYPAELRSAMRRVAKAYTLTDTSKHETFAHRLSYNTRRALSMNDESPELYVPSFRRSLYQVYASPAARSHRMKLDVRTARIRRMADDYDGVMSNADIVRSAFDAPVTESLDVQDMYAFERYPFRGIISRSSVPYDGAIVPEQRGGVDLSEIYGTHGARRSHSSALRCGDDVGAAPAPRLAARPPAPAQPAAMHRINRDRMYSTEPVMRCNEPCDNPRCKLHEREEPEIDFAVFD